MKLPQRKHVRLKGYDYSRDGYYYVTISTENNLPILSSVGRGLAPAAVEVRLSSIGEIAQEQLLELEKRYPYVKVDKHVIMPTHIHVILVFSGQTAGASPRPTLTDVLCTYKSLTTRLCNQRDNNAGRKIFQTSFYETVIRDETGYQEVWQYIETNPTKWESNCFHCE